MNRQALEVYQGRTLTRPFTMSVGGDGSVTARMRVWDIADEPIDEDTYTFPIETTLTFDTATGEGVILLTAEHTAGLAVGGTYRWRIEGIAGDETTVTIGGRLYVGATYGQ